MWRSGEIAPLAKCLLASSSTLGLVSSFGIVRTCLSRFLAQTEDGSSLEIFMSLKSDWDCQDIQPHGLSNYQLSGFSTVRQPLFDYMDPIV